MSDKDDINNGVISCWEAGPVRITSKISRVIFMTRLKTKKKTKVNSTAKIGRVHATA